MLHYIIFIVLFIAVVQEWTIYIEYREKRKEEGDPSPNPRRNMLALKVILLLGFLYYSWMTGAKYVEAPPPAYQAPLYPIVPKRLSNPFTPPPPAYQSPAPAYQSPLYPILPKRF